MLARVLLTAASLTVAAAAAALIDCSVAAVELFGGDPIGICSTASSLGLTGDIWVGLGLAGIAGLFLAWTWVPALRPGERRRRLAAAQSLERNLGRIPEVGGEADRSAGSPPDRDFLADLWRRLEAVEVSLGSEGASREATERWMGLLREANDLHNSGELSTEQFKEINTRLLDLFTRPSEFVDA
jgi:hypothetical protein